jgi:hypothetical protein
MEQSRRKFLKLLLIGSGILVLGKITGLKWLSPDKIESKDMVDLGNFKIVKSGEQLDFFNKREEKVFSLHDDGTLEV